MPDDSRPGSFGPKPGPEPKPDSPRGPRFPRGLMPILILLVVVAVVIKVVTDEALNTSSMSFSEFRSTWNENEHRYEGFSSAILQDDTLILEKTSPKANQKPKSEGDKTKPEDAASTLLKRYTVKVPQTAIDSDFLNDLATIPDFKVEPTNKLFSTVLVSMLWLGVIVFVFYILIIRPLRSQGGPGNVLAFGRSRPKLISKEHSGVKFDDVAGIEEAKEEVSEVIEFLKNPKKFERLGGRIPRGLLFVGAPGTGKTLLAKAIAGEADVPFYSICGSDFVEMFVGVGASRVRDLFRQAKENAPCIIFLDEVDAVGRRRGSGLGGGHDEREQTLNAILVEMDGFDTNEQVIVIAATNRPDVLDPALLRPGRFDREIVINLPDVKGRFEILKVHARRIKLAADVNLERIARGTPMFSGADLEAIINEAAICATMSAKDFVEESDLEEARDKVRFGREKRSRVLDEQDRKVTAFHEAGHAMVTRLCPDVEPLHKVTIIPRGMYLGATMQLPLKDRQNLTRNMLLGQLKVLFGGRIAEELFCDDISSGAVGDIEHATDIARKMVCDYGMSAELGPIRYASKEQHLYLGGESVQPREFSEATAERIDQAVRKIIDQCYADTEQMLRSNTHDTELVAKALLKHETLSAEEINAILKANDINVVVKVLNEQNDAQPTTDEPAAAEQDMKATDDLAADPGRRVADAAS